MTQKVSALPVGVAKIRFSFRHHVAPPLVGIGVSLLMYALLNLPLIEAQARYYINTLTVPSSTAGQATATATVSHDLSQVIIPSISVKAPVIYEASPNNTAIAYDLRSGVVHYGTTALPGEKGNAVLFGHSSGVAWAPGDYKFVFTLLDKLQPGQQISVDYQGTRYVYVVTDKLVVPPTDMHVLATNGAQSQLTLITCTPVGTSKNRLVVHAQQIAPNPATNKPFKPANTAVLDELPSN